MAAFDLKQDWPIVAAGGAVLVGVVLVTRGRAEVTNLPVRVGGAGANGTRAAAIQGQVAIAQTQAQAFTGLFSSLVGGVVRSEEIAAQREVGLAQAGATVRAAELQAQAQQAAIAAALETQRLQAAAQLSAIQAQAAAQQQSSLFGFLGSIAPFIFGLFCEDVTQAARVSRYERGKRWHAAFPEFAPLRAVADVEVPSFIPRPQYLIAARRVA